MSLPYTPQTMLEIDKAHLLHPLHHPNTHQNPQIWQKGIGSVLTDQHGKEFFDGLSGLWNVNVGHGRQELADAAAHQMKTLAYCSSYSGSSNGPAIQLSARLAERFYSNINAFFFTSGGGESNESAIKTARFYWKTLGHPNKTGIIGREYGYHGVTLAAMSATGLERYWPMFEPRVPGFSHIKSPYPLYFNHHFSPTAEAPTPGIAAANLLEKEIVRRGSDTVAAFIAEPVQGSGGVIVPQDDYFKRIREICDQHQILLITDEVITGFGRTGRWFGLERDGVQPDMVSFAKGITSGYLPLGGIGVSDAIHQVLDNAPFENRWMHAYTYSGHPTACAVALANLDLIESMDLVSKAETHGKRLLEGIAVAAAANPYVAEVRGSGMMMAIELLEDVENRVHFEPEGKMGAKLNAACVKRGLWSRAKEDVYMLAPPLSTSAAEIEQIIEIVSSALQAILE